MYVLELMCTTCMQVPKEARVPGIGGAGGYEPPTVDAGN